MGHEPLQRSPNASSMAPPPSAPAYPLLRPPTLLSYDNRVMSMACGPTTRRHCCSSAAKYGVSPLWVAAISRDGQGPARRAGPRFLQTDRVKWQLQTLASMTGTAFLVTLTDTMLQCDENELLSRASRLSHENQVLIGGEFSSASGVRMAGQ